MAKQLNMSVSRAVKAGEQEFTMRLDPAELGRVQVKLKFMEGGRVHAQVVAERPETLELLQRDARGLNAPFRGLVPSTGCHHRIQPRSRRQSGKRGQGFCRSRATGKNA
ncbi:flagellar hook-length control protein FliK [Kordiimonas gwangyangensis]|uniref:flagellar hook-length control protein FliK n=1 Tax=Kordiimonas gwangyangensis TaxID=288022 RepID=UPI00046E89BC|nr:flagellar hook-length control protein FliK [Kordiimonas gwangyangensis]